MEGLFIPRLCIVGFAFRETQFDWGAHGSAAEFATLRLSEECCIMKICILSIAVWGKKLFFNVLGTELLPGLYKTVIFVISIASS